MADIGLIAMPPLQARAIGQGSAIVELAPQRSIASISVYKHTLEQLQSALGLVLPAASRQVSAAGVMYLWSGPESWLAIAGTDNAGFQTRLTERTKNLAAVTDQSDGRTILRITGASARTTLAKLLPIDLHPSVFTPDTTALTLAGHIAVQIWQVAENTYELACFRSFAEALYEALLEAGLEYQQELF